MKLGSEGVTRGGEAAVFHALSEPTRLALLEHLSSGEHRVRDLVDHLGLAQSTVSKHLACLRDCGLVTVRSEGRASWFALADAEGLDALLRAAGRLADRAGSRPLAEHLAHDAQLAGRS
ncbi:winged helix-turn-helix transcriptional regulator [Nocardioides sp. zg-536]|uniref:Winged helix-turn-helix transcriptional regulator n=2 Tax=Nocardioides faecalis TaxID=2803858 RepID=A0A939BXR7_9ACTN|nr:metalloregulator ArsR/SmtB family transcription factor [Nocardioides faecalis]MBM9459130.1 winged helix-turn-helix transcriptional regulator [Nocardioides faecalis]MBS4753771.1 winged helix-turn-helix transcriptional regulator [Nocardioides faecalis]QVI60579.1 winged helix-turn-helix transcriptional regulator [Nocardioides faecalis]